ncbi:GNAT family N-acetyltransferase [Acinetobacter stercoris]|uniref:Uncharacterized protein n=1 Tax=Acinetobacter stercoris TaxID=2126983 RepID=A0A2U3MZC7_9GAMM|nr:MULTISPECIES: GNAT family N-acetyltransferase [Acinetobacter]SPL70735.1 hypothetical protein KPC_1913 [Acinetobacter stercoris]
MLEIKHVDDGKKGEFFIGEDGHHLAEMAYTWAGDDKFIIDHTIVSDELRGQGVGRKLLDQTIELARDKNVKIIPLCPFSKSEFEKDASIRDVLN